jgi:thiol:disulfide interchange protein DsbD
MKKILQFLLFIFFVSAYPADTLLTLRVLESPKSVSAGDTFSVAINAVITPSWHVWGHSLSDPYLISSNMVLTDIANIETLGVVYPEGVLKTLMGLTERLYEDTVLFSIKLKALADTGEIKFTAVLKYQGCNDKVCLPPTESKVNVTIPASGGSMAQQDGIAGKLAGLGLVTALFFLFLSGIGLCLTPCVYPIIPITLGFFTAQASGSRSKTFFLAALYALGIAITYSLLGTVAALSGSILGSALQHPMVVVGISLVFALFALSMFGLYEFRLPSTLNQLAVGRQGFAGALIMGMIVGVVAAPCVGPVTAGLLVYVAEKQDPFLGFIYFFALAAGLGTPFFLLGLFSGSFKKLPSSGGWLNWIKKLFGFIMLGMAAYYLIPILGLLVVNVAIMVIALAGAIYLGFIDGSAPAGSRFRSFQRLFGAMVLLVCFWSINSVLISEKKNDSAGTETQHRAFSLEVFGEAAASGKPFVVDFRADWCAPCREFEAKVLTDSEVKKELEILPFYSADLTNNSDPSSQKLIEKFRITGVPTLIFFNNSGIEVNRYTGFMEKMLFLEAVRSLNRK